MDVLIRTLSHDSRGMARSTIPRSFTNLRTALEIFLACGEIMAILFVVPETMIKYTDSTTIRFTLK